jgi:TnpA family transposase
LVEEEILSGLADLKRDAKDFKARMMGAERDKLIAIKSLYLFIKNLLPNLKLSQQNIQHYATLIHYYTIYDLRQRIKPEQTQLYLLCFIWQRYHQLNDNLIDAFFCCLKKLEHEVKEKGELAFSEHIEQEHSDLLVMKRLARLFINEQEWSDKILLGKIRKEAFKNIISKDELQNKIGYAEKQPLKKIDFKWQTIDKLFHRYQLQLRPLVMALDFSSLELNNPWLSTVMEFKNLIASQKTLNGFNIDSCPVGTLPKRIKPYLLEEKDDVQQLIIKRYEFWIYRQLKKRLKNGDLYLADSIHHRSIEQELSIAKEKQSLINELNIPVLHEPIKELLDKHFFELDKQWLSFNLDLSSGKLNHLFYDEKNKTLHLKKSNDDNIEEEQHLFYQQLPLCDIADVFQFVNEQCDFLSAFSHIQPRYTKMDADKESLSAAIIAQALNNGNANMAEISDVSYDKLQDAYQSRIRLQTLKGANDLISEDIAKMPIFPFYSLDLHIRYGGVDGQKFEVKTPMIKARPSKKYFKKGRGVVAYTLLFNHIPLQVELIGAHDHESYFAFDIWYNNTTNIMPDAITGDMHLINKANFAIMDWFGANLCPRFTNMQSQVKHLYCGDNPSKYDQQLIKPIGQINRLLIEEEWPNIKPIIEALGIKEITQSILIKKLCTYTSSNRIRKAIFEYDKLIRSIYTLKYLQNRTFQRDVHKSQNRVESYHQLRAAIATAYGRKQLIGRGEREIEISNQCGRLLANVIIHYNSAILSKLKQKYEAENNVDGLAMLRKISPVAWRHIHFQGHLIFSGNKQIDIDSIIGKIIMNKPISKSKTKAKDKPEILPVYA